MFSKGESMSMQDSDFLELGRRVADALKLEPKPEPGEETSPPSGEGVPPAADAADPPVAPPPPKPEDNPPKAKGLAGWWYAK